MNPTPIDLQYDTTHGLRLTWDVGAGLHLNNVAVRVRLRGTHRVQVWTGQDSGEGPPLWEEPDLDLTFFGSDEESPGFEYRIERVRYYDQDVGARVISSCPRAEVALELRVVQGRLEAGVSVWNPAPAGGRSLPLAALDLELRDIPVGPDAEYLSAHAYGGRTHGWGRIAQLDGSGAPFVHGCIGLAMPLVYVHNPQTANGLEVEFMLEERPWVWLQPGSVPGRIMWRVAWGTERLLAPGQTHAYGGRLCLRGYQGRPVEAMRQWRDDAEERYGLTAAPAPDWARRMNIIEFNMHPKSGQFPWTQLGDPRVREQLRTWKDMGYTSIFAVAHNHTYTHWLSPLDYEPSDEAGGFEGERQFLTWAHELGFHVFLWVTTVGLDKTAPEARDHADWWTHRRDGSLFYAWDSRAPDYVGYAPDGDPLSAGWRAWLKDQVKRLVRRGFDGIFVDGCIPRASNHARWDWPGQGRDGVADQVRDLARFVRGLGPDLILFVEDEGLYAQACAEVTQGRYLPMTPFFKKPFWDHGMGGGPAAATSPPARIPPEMARDYLLVRYASLLPGRVSSDIVEGYFSDAARPWGAQSLLAGCVPKTHSQYVDRYETWQSCGEMGEASDAEKSPEHRRQGHEEWVKLLRFCRDEPLIREAPLSIEGVVVEGDAAVVGFLKASPNRAILSLIQFADRAARVSVRLAEPVDVPRKLREGVGRPDLTEWTAREILRSMAERDTAPDGVISGSRAMEVEMGRYGYRVFELRGWR